jgi:hypothetical protein
MVWREKLYERRLKRPVDTQTLDEIRSEFHRRSHEIPVPMEVIDHPTKPELTIKTRWLSFIVQFNAETVVVDAELSLAAKVFATEKNRQVAIDFIDSIANDLNL